MFVRYSVVMVFDRLFSLLMLKILIGIFIHKSRRVYIYGCVTRASMTCNYAMCTWKTVYIYIGRKCFVCNRVALPFVYVDVFTTTLLCFVEHKPTTTTEVYIPYNIYTHRVQRSIKGKINNIREFEIGFIISRNWL